MGEEGEKRQKEDSKRELEVMCQLGSGRSLFKARMKDQERWFQLDTQMIKQALNRSHGCTAGKEILLRLKINILCCLYAELFF